MIHTKFKSIIYNSSRITKDFHNFYYSSTTIIGLISVWRVSDWWRHLRKHLGRNATNYFMYDKRTQSDPPHDSELLHLNEAEACLQRVTERTFYGISPLSGLPLRKILSGLPVF